MCWRKRCRCFACESWWLLFFCQPVHCACVKMTSHVGKHETSYWCVLFATESDWSSGAGCCCLSHPALIDVYCLLQRVSLEQWSWLLLSLTSSSYWCVLFATESVTGAVELVVAVSHIQLLLMCIVCYRECHWSSGAGCCYLSHPALIDVYCLLQRVSLEQWSWLLLSLTSSSYWCVLFATESVTGAVELVVAVSHIQLLLMCIVCYRECHWSSGAGCCCLSHPALIDVYCLLQRVSLEQWSWLLLSLTSSSYWCVLFATESVTGAVELVVAVSHIQLLLMCIVCYRECDWSSGAGCCCLSHPALIDVYCLLQRVSLEQWSWLLISLTSSSYWCVLFATESVTQGSTLTGDGGSMAPKSWFRAPIVTTSMRPAVSHSTCDCKVTKCHLGTAAKSVSW